MSRTANNINKANILNKSLLNLDYFFFFKERCDITVLVFNPSPLTVPPASWDWSTIFCAGFTTGNQPEKHPPFQS